MPLILTIGPMLTMGLISAVTVLNTINGIVSGKNTLANSWPQLVTSGIMLISMLVWPLITQTYNKKRRKKKLKETINKYNKYLDKKREELLKEYNNQKIILTENLITVDQCIDIIKHQGIGFWDKRNDQSDFLVVRIGIGNTKFDADIAYTEEEFSIDESELRNKADQLIEEFKYIKDVPIGYSLKEHKTVAIMGNEYKTYNFVNNILLQVITFYSYEDLKIVIFTNDDKKYRWEYLKYLNHTFNNDKTFRFFATDYESTKNVAEYLNYETSIRLNNENKLLKPHYLIITDSYEDIKHYDFVNYIAEEEENFGFSFLILENKLSKLPSKCNDFITIGENKSSLLKNSYETQEQEVFMDEIKYNINMMELVKILSNIPIEFEESNGELPDSINFLEMEKVGKVEQLNILNRWNNNDSTNSLKAEVGVDESGNLMYLDLHEKYHGPHGLIAGMTGSGKSEFIITYILSMCINYSPDDVAFILIDYKGGGLAGAFENKLTGIVLPHLAGTITNLDKAEMDRTLVSIDSEIKRRQTVFNDARDKLGESTIDIYKYQRFYKDGKLDEPVPHLFIICDEFAELKSQQPDFMDNLISVARIGRSLGVHLILATQKPSGVVNDQIWSNTKFRVCLKVQDESDSKEMLKRPEAAHLKQTGRFYLQVGYDEYFALGQSGWCGAKYYPSEKIIRQVDKSVNFINDCGEIIKSIQASNNIKIEAQGEQLLAILKSIISISEKVNKKAKKLWLDNIPPIITIDYLEKKYNFNSDDNSIRVVLGEYDAPEIQAQGAIIHDYLENGNTIIYGNDGSEREMLLNTLIYSSVKNYSSEKINFYIIDYGSEALKRYSSLPHVGGIVFDGESEKYNNLFKLIKEEIQYRKKLFVDYGGEYKDYIKNSGNKLPISVFIINNYDSANESNKNLYDEMPELTRDSERYGIIFILTANAINSVYGKISSNFSTYYAFKLKDVMDYSALFGIRKRIMPRDIFGRGVLNNGDLHEFQTASITENNDELNDFVFNFVKKQKQLNQKKAKRIPVLPNIVGLKNVESEISDLNNIPIGISKNDLNVCTFDSLNNLGNIITSNKINNTKVFVLSLIDIIKIINNNIIIIDAMKDLINDKYYQNYYNDDFDNVLDMLIKSIQSLIDNKNENYGTILIYGLKKFISNISDSKKLNEFTTLIKKYEKINVIVVDDSIKIKEFVFETWYKNIFSSNDGIWIGNGFSNQSLFRVSNITRDMNLELKNDMGYIISDSNAICCKFIDFITNIEEE